MCIRDRYGEEIMACVILKEGETSSEEEIKAYVRDHMAKHKVPRYVTFVPEFPMNAAGKILPLIHISGTACRCQGLILP